MKHNIADDFRSALLALLGKDFDLIVNEAAIYRDLDEYIWFNLKRVPFNTTAGDIFFKDFQR